MEHSSETNTAHSEAKAHETKHDDSHSSQTTHETVETQLNTETKTDYSDSEKQLFESEIKIESVAAPGIVVKLEGKEVKLEGEQIEVSLKEKTGEIEAGGHAHNEHKGEHAHMSEELKQEEQLIASEAVAEKKEEVVLVENVPIVEKIVLEEKEVIVVNGEPDKVPEGNAIPYSEVAIVSNQDAIVVESQDVKVKEVTLEPQEKVEEIVLVSELKEEVETVVESQDVKVQEVTLEPQEKVEEIVLVSEPKEKVEAVIESIKEEVKEEIKVEPVVVNKVEVKEEIKEEAKEVVVLSDAEKDIQTLDDLALKIVNEFEIWMRLDDAYKHYQEFAALCDQIKKKNVPEVIEYIDHLNREHRRTFLDIRSNYEYMKKIVVDIENETGWTTEKSSEGYTIKYKTGGSEIASLKIEGVMDVPLENLLALIYEIELYNKWLPFMKTTTELKSINRGFKVSYMKLSIPPPLSDRETLLVGFGVDRFLSHGTVLILARSIDKDKEFIKDHKIVLPPDTTGSLLAMNVACFEYKYLGPSKVRMRAIVNIDPQIRFLPNMFMSFLLRKSGSLIYSKMYKSAKHFKGSIWEERLNSPKSKDFYDWLRKRIKDESERVAKEGKIPISE